MDTYHRYLRLVAEGDAMDRLVFFSDAVFAIAMTLLIVELHVPEVAGADLGPALLALVPGYLTFMLSFVVVGMVWMSHHRKFRVIVRYDQKSRPAEPLFVALRCLDSTAYGDPGLLWRRTP